MAVKYKLLIFLIGVMSCAMGLQFLMNEGWKDYVPETRQFLGKMGLTDTSNGSIKNLLIFVGILYLIAGFLLIVQKKIGAFFLILALLPAVLWRYNPYITGEIDSQHNKMHFYKAVSLIGLAIMILSKKTVVVH